MNNLEQTTKLNDSSHRLKNYLFNNEAASIRISIKETQKEIRNIITDTSGIAHINNEKRLIYIER